MAALRGGADSYERGAPVHISTSRHVTHLAESLADLIRTSVHDTYSGSMKITTHLDRISDHKTASDTNWSTKIDIPSHRHQYSPRLDQNCLGEAWEAADTEALAPLFGNPKVIGIVPDNNYKYLENK